MSGITQITFLSTSKQLSIQLTANNFGRLWTRTDFRERADQGHLGSSDGSYVFNVGFEGAVKNVIIAENLQALEDASQADWTSHENDGNKVQYLLYYKRS